MFGVCCCLLVCWCGGPGQTNEGQMRLGTCGDVGDACLIPPMHSQDQIINDNDNINYNENINTNNYSISNSKIDIRQFFFCETEK